MNKLSVALFSVLFLAVAGLYVIILTGDKKDKVTDFPVTESSVQSQGIGYVNIDSVIFKFDMFFDLRDDLMEKQESAEAELTAKGNQYERDARDYQDKVNKGLVTRATAAQMEQALLEQQQELINLRDQFQSDLLEEEQVMNRQIIEYIVSYLEENRSEFNYQYILGKSFGSVVLYSDSSLDLTNRVLDAINSKYQREN